MANEAVCYVAPTRFAQVVVADAGAIEKGTVIALTSPNTGAASSADNDVFGGIAVEEKVANDGKTTLSVALDGEWGLLATAAGITVGTDVTIGGANQIKAYTTLDDEKGYVVGKALETTAGGAVIRVRLKGY